MTLQEIRDRVEAIRGATGDDETAHIWEDKLREDFIRYVAGLDDFEKLDALLSKKAQLVLETKQLEFARWCA